MKPNKTSLSANDAWEQLLSKYHIAEEVQSKGYFRITAQQIKEFKEPRLMAKWDSSSSLPQALKQRKLNILPDSRRSYVIGDFLLYQELPELKERVEHMEHIDLPEYESVDVENIGSEANAINVLLLTGILDDFLSDGKNVATFNGRMGTGVFDFVVNTQRKSKQLIHVDTAQCEIDGGFENENSVVIMEAKNVEHEDFHVRQLYYPYRLWHEKVSKPIRLVFSIYSNMIFRLFEYRFSELSDYSSIELVRTKNYSLQDTSISIDELISVRNNTPIVTDDNMDNTKIPFIQADSMARIISILENMYGHPMTKQEIAELMDFELRQANYYTSAGKYLGLFRSEQQDGQILVSLTPCGNGVFKLNYKERQLKLVSLMLEHRIFADAFDYVIKNGELPEKKRIQEDMRSFHVCAEGQIVRRSFSVFSWLKWMFNLTNL